VLGGSGSGLIVAETLVRLAERGQAVRLAGFLNDAVGRGEHIGEYRVLGAFADWQKLPSDLLFIAAFPAAKAAAERHARLNGLEIPDERWTRVIDPSALIAGSARLDLGCYVAPNVIVEHGAQIGRHTILRAGAYVSHDVRIGDFAFVGPNVTILGRSIVGTGVHLAANSVCRDGLSLGDYAVIGLGSVVLSDVAPHAIVAGNPARLLSSLEASSSSRSRA